MPLEGNRKDTDKTIKAPTYSGVLQSVDVRRTCPHKDPFLWPLPGGNIVNIKLFFMRHRAAEDESRAYISSYYFKVDINMIKVNLMWWCHRNASKNASQQQAFLAIFTQILTWCFIQKAEQRGGPIIWVWPFFFFKQQHWWLGLCSFWIPAQIITSIITYLHIKLCFWNIIN